MNGRLKEKRINENEKHGRKEEVGKKMDVKRVNILVEKKERKTI